MTKTLDELPIFAWAHNARPEIVHHEVKSLWLKVSAQQVENYIEPLVLLEDVRSALRELIADAELKEQENHLLRLRVIDLQQRLQYTPPATFAATNITLDANSPPLPFPTHQG